MSIWSAGACSRFLGGQLAARPERASEQARRKRQQAAALQIRPDRHYPVILQLWDFDVPLFKPILKWINPCFADMICG